MTALKPEAVLAKLDAAMVGHLAWVAKTICDKVAVSSTVMRVMFNEQLKKCNVDHEIGDRTVRKFLAMLQLSCKM